MSLLEFPLLQLPNELILIISKYLNANDLNSLSRTNHRLAELLSLRLENLRDNLLSQIAKQDGKTGLCSAVERKNEALVRLVLKRLVVDINEKIDIRGRTTLHWAAGNGHSELVELLLERGADIAAQTINGSTPLHKAVSDEGIVRILLNRGADVTARSGWGSTPLNSAVESGHEQTVKLLLEFGSDVNTETLVGETPLHTAAYYGHESISKILLDYGANIHARTRMGHTPLHQSIRGHNPCESLVKILLEKGAYVNAHTHEQETALHFAAGSKNAAIVKVLIDAGASIPTVDSSGNTPLHWVALQGDIQIMTMLLENHLDINAPTIPPRRLGPKSQEAIYQTVLHLTALKTAPFLDEQWITFLLDQNADITAADSYGMTALHYASQTGNRTMVTLLLEREANVLARSNDNRTALHAAAMGGHTEIARLLLDHGADIDAVETKKKRTPLALAVKGGHEGTVRLLLERGADMGHFDVRGDTVLGDAAASKLGNIVRILLEWRDVSQY